MANMDNDVNPATAGIKRAAPAMYLVLRAGNTTPEIFQAESDEDAQARLNKEAVRGQIPIVYWYKLMGAVEFVPTSRSTSLDEILSNPAMSPIKKKEDEKSFSKEDRLKEHIAKHPIRENLKTFVEHSSEHKLAASGMY